MSGFAGILHLDGAPVERDLLQRLTDYQKFRGPDAQSIWIDGSVGFGHTLLRTDPESEPEQQPLTLDNETWIVADCRVDARRALIAELQGRRHQGITEVTDAELILRAYSVWGDDCVQHLLGDFVFAIWDGLHQRLFCARDQMGVKPFFYAHVGEHLIFSNTLDCIRQHPAVSSELNELAIADFLLFDMIRDPEATSFREIHRLPPAHTLICIKGKIATRRYWTMPVCAPIPDSRQDECVEQFLELLDTVVADRLRTKSAGVLMGGGLDSTTVAASAQRSFRRRGNRSGLCAYTEVFDSVIPHEERRYAGIAAQGLKIPIEFQVTDEIGLWKYLSRLDNGWPEPLHSPWSDWGLRQLRHIALTRRVALTGYGGDPTLSCLLTIHFAELFKKRRFGRAIAAAIRYLLAEGRFSRLYIRTRWRRWRYQKNQSPPYPRWLQQDLEERLGLRERFRAMVRITNPNAAVRPVAYEAVVDPMWPNLFEGFDAGVTRAPVEVCHPFFDLRLVNFLLALPALPWCSDKELLRRSARGVLPDAIRLRPKSPLLADPLIVLLQRPESSWVDRFEPTPELKRYVDRNRIPEVLGEKDVWNAWVNLRPLSLNLWLRSQALSGITLLGLK
jgi:asparagine synthase (glutamine-hydrolysing)